MVSCRKFKFGVSTLEVCYENVLYKFTFEF